MSKGTLFLIPVPLADEAAARSFTPFVNGLINHINEYIVENEKTARKFLKEAGLKTPQNDLILHDYSKHNRSQLQASFFDGLESGKDVGLMSEAGCPAIADPGADIVAEAHKRGIRVIPLPGPSSIILALMASGFNGQSFTFHGYLPIDKSARTKKIKEIESAAERFNQTQLFIETPFRNNQMLDELLRTCKPQSRLCIASNLTSPDELIISDSISGWKYKKADFHKIPAVFLLFKAK